MQNCTPRKIYGLILLCLAFSMQSFSQQEAYCATETTQQDDDYLNNIMPQIKAYEQEFYNLQQNRSSTVASSIPIKAHIIRTDAGTGGLSEADLNDALDLVNAYYADTFMEFFICDGINYIDDTNFYDFETNDEGALTAAHQVPNLINIYFTETVAISSGGAACGYAYLPGGPDVILMDNQCTTNGSTLIHEIGHFFSLRHTHGNSNTTLTDELVDGSNCDTAGDQICDTPADPRLSGLVTPQCVYTGTAVDANGDAFMPDTTNFMSYSRQSCRDSFTPQQLARIYAGYQTRNDFSCPSFNADFAADFNRDCGDQLSVDFNDSSVGAVSWEWDVDGDDVIDYTTQNPSHTYAPGIYDVALTISNGTETISKVFANLIDFETQTVSTTDIYFTLNTDDWSQETSWNFRTVDGTVLYSGGPYNGTTDDFSEFTETFENLSVGECYVFEIIDSFGDGICCASGNGSYELRTDLTDDTSIIASGGEIGFGETKYIANESLSVKDFDLNAISIYPNPVNDNVLFIQSNNRSFNMDYRIHNLLGQEISSGKLQQEQIDVSAITSGTYFLTLSIEGNKVVKKFIKQ